MGTPYGELGSWEYPSPSSQEAHFVEKWSELEESRKSRRDCKVKLSPTQEQKQLHVNPQIMFSECRMPNDKFRSYTDAVFIVN